MKVKYESKEPCCRCIHKKVCSATRCLNEMEYTIAHPFFNIKVECTEYYNEQLACTEYYNEQLATMNERQLIKESEE